MPNPTPPTRPAPSKQDPLSDRLLHALTTTAARRALAERDITTVYRLLTQADISQRQIAQMTGQSQSEVSEVLKGRRVMAYDVLVRVAQGLKVPRSWMGLAYDEGAESKDPAVGEEVIDEDMRRRALLAAASIALFGAPVLGEVL
jgi:transcriptional regulator with XRE-family HTH domain